MAKKEKKKPTIKTLEDRGTKVDLVDFGDGRQTLFFRTEEFKGLTLGAVKVGWTNKYAIVSPKAITGGTLDVMSANASALTGSPIRSGDFVVIESPEVKPEEKKPKKQPEK